MLQFRTIKIEMFSSVYTPVTRDRIAEISDIPFLRRPKLRPERAHAAFDEFYISYGRRLPSPE